MPPRQAQFRIVFAAAAIIVALVSAGPAFAQHQHGAPAPSGDAKPAGQAPSAGPPSVTLGPDQVKLIGARTVAASVRELSRVIRTVGRVEPDERRQAYVTVKVEGFIEKLYADYTGAPVAKGQTLAAIYSPDVMAVQLEILSLQKWRESAAKSGSGDTPAGQAQNFAGADAEAMIRAAQERLRLLDAGSNLAGSLSKTGKPARTMAVVSPIAGTVVAKNAVLGGRVMPGDKLFEIADLSKLWVLAEVYEYELQNVSLGQSAEITFKAFPGRTFAAKLDFIAPTLTPDTRTVKLRFVLDNPEGLIKPLMYAEVELLTKLGPRLAVPESAVIDTGERQIVYVETAEGIFALREVSVGARAAGLAEITKGLAQGEKVASSANFLIDSETRLSGGGGGSGHQH
jgi:membrane fusion protein, copper/silver efflux system